MRQEQVLRRGRKFMPNVEAVTATESYQDQCEDFVAVLHDAARTIVVVADGAGGTGSGDVAAKSVIREVEAAYAAIHSEDEWAHFLRQVDLRIPEGATTAVVIDVRPYGIAGASVGDSQAWIVDRESIEVLTEKQSRKPLLGSGDATPVGFTHRPLDGILFVATDGFFDYAQRDAIQPMILGSDFYTIPRRAIELVRLPSGALWDDVGVVAARTPPKRRTRKRYPLTLE